MSQATLQLSVCCTAVDQHWKNQGAPPPCAKWGLRRNNKFCVQHWQRQQDRTGSKHGWRGNTLFLDWCRRLSRDEVLTSLTSMRSVCAVSRPVMRSVLRSQTIPQPTRWMCRLPQATCQATQGESWLEQHFRATDLHSNSYRVTTCCLWADIRVRSRPLPCTRCTTWDHNKHQACSSRKKWKNCEKVWTTLKKV